MTSTSELFHRRRYRFTHRHNTSGDVSVFDSSLPAPAVAVAVANSSHQNRTSNRRYSSLNTRREPDGCDPASRRLHRCRRDHAEHEVVEAESSSGSIINSDDFRSIHRVRDSGSDRLPGSVLLARERLVERLRGVSVSGNRPNVSSNANNNLLEIRNERVEETRSESWETLTRRNHPHGLSQDALNRLQLEVFFINENDDEMLRECTICLECFEDGDKVIRLNCKHTFHSGCLFPWVRVCGACPNCRKHIVVNGVDVK